ncbi:uncharacterized protein LACBIDRAFT_306783 [Laccaria bicolor S238N-H82]|uniref:Predicted protein n=1 Tax=Laccaria bicolor (strain S238N-H82 / ATCC MYA-4686) TaxID=486041 RepID=B0DNP5_LACBS|nr:uncharacterized protein LACBIDRAFT_306783 [Laccaria bicolor S238N-H82]EDR03690.1 predicted protein [Laccaria bicolor S238N-H82]|eukprot:XP_001885543.1 predicted protein [Laccaria bicolor S238N-H82]
MEKLRRKFNQRFLLRLFWTLFYRRQQLGIVDKGVSCRAGLLDNLGRAFIKLQKCPSLNQALPKIRCSIKNTTVWRDRTPINVVPSLYKM